MNVCPNCESFMSDRHNPCPECDHEGCDDHTSEDYNAHCKCNFCLNTAERFTDDPDEESVHDQMPPDEKARRLHLPRVDQIRGIL